MHHSNRHKGIAIIDEQRKRELNEWRARARAAKAATKRRYRLDLPFFFLFFFAAADDALGREALDVKTAAAAPAEGSIATVAAAEGVVLASECQSSAALLLSLSLSPLLLEREALRLAPPALAAAAGAAS